MRVAFGEIGGTGWTGGANYLANLLSAIAATPERKVQPVLFVGPDAELATLERLSPFLGDAPVIDDCWRRGSRTHTARLGRALVLQRDVTAERHFRRANIDLVFQHGSWFGTRFPIPTLAWIADFQHRYLPGMFTTWNWLKREVGYRALARSASRLLLSSEDARRDCEKFYPRSRARTSVLRFAINPTRMAEVDDPALTRMRFGLPERYFFFPSQFWRHKNHLVVLAALRLLSGRGAPICMAFSGALSEPRDPGYPRAVVTMMQKADLQDQCRMLEFVSHRDVVDLMRASVAVVNPSLFEGWSTTVEEAKSLGVPLLLSDLPVHREQAPELCRYFDPRDPSALADVLAKAWEEWPAGPRVSREAEALQRARRRWQDFGRAFETIAVETVRQSSKET